MIGLNKPWPPLIVAEKVPRLVKWRDLVLTSTLWGMFALLIGLEFKLVLRDFLIWMRHVSFDGRADWVADWLVYFELLLPFLLAAVVLPALLLIFSMQTLRRRARALLLPQPAPLTASEEARRAVLDEVALIAVRNCRIVIVHIDAESKLRVEQKA
jgi:hypothetical protein